MFITPPAQRVVVVEASLVRSRIRERVVDATRWRRAHGTAVRVRAGAVPLVERVDFDRYDGERLVGAGEAIDAGKGAEQMATKQQARRASEAGTSAVVKGFSHIPHGNTALSVKADEARLASITDEKERKRLKRLLRNRVSAQQARERKKAYLSSLEQQED